MRSSMRADARGGHLVDLSPASARRQRQEFLVTPRQILDARLMGGEAFTTKYAEGVNNIFYPLENEIAVPVVIAARNEENDLPALLSSLAGNGIPLAPLVVDSASTDRTPDFAKAFNASVITVDQPGKQIALSEGLRHIFELRGFSEVILFTDADVVVPSTWAEILVNAIRSMSSEVPRAVAGTVEYYEDGKKGFKNALLTAMCLARDKKAWRAGAPRAHGNTMAIYPAGLKTVADAVVGLEHTHGPAKPKEDQAMFGVFREYGETMPIFDPGARIIARGDRYPTLRSAARAVLPGGDKYWEKTLYGTWLPHSAEPARSPAELYQQIA
jgi:glycosyltransferase involved in cell wall biosynthesis